MPLPRNKQLRAREANYGDRDRQAAGKAEEHDGGAVAQHAPPDAGGLRAQREAKPELTGLTVHDISPYSPMPASNKRKRFYFRKRGMKDIPLPGVPGSEEFMQAYAMAFAALPGA